MGAPSTSMSGGSSRSNNRVNNNVNSDKNAAHTTTSSSLEETYTSLIQEYLQVMCYDNATFLAERMVAATNRNSINAYYLLATCYYRSDAPQRALSVLESHINNKTEHPPSIYLMAKCCYDMKQYGRAEETLLEIARNQYKVYKAKYNNATNNNNTAVEDNTIMTMNEWIVETSPCPIPNGAAGLYLLGNVCRRANRKKRAIDYYNMSLQLDPLMWSSYESLCELGADDIDPTSVFGVRPVQIDQLQERLRQQKKAQEESAAASSMPLQEKSVLRPHYFTPPSASAAALPPSSSLGGTTGRGTETPLGTTPPIGLKASLFQTAQKSTIKAGDTGSSTAILPNQLQFDTPNLTPIPVQQDASFIQQNHYPPSSAMGNTSSRQHSTMMSGTDFSVTGFVDSHNPHTVRRAKCVAARLYYQPSPETPQDHHNYAEMPASSRSLHNGVEAPFARRYLRGKSALRNDTFSGIPLETTISETPLRRGGGRPSDISTTRRPRALFLSENKPMRENTNDLNHSHSSTNIGEDDDEENNFRSGRSRVAFDRDSNGFDMDDENHPDDEQSNMMMTEDINTANSNTVNAGGRSSSMLPDEEKPPMTTITNQHDDAVALEDAMMEKHSAVQQILELFCLLGAGYLKLCQFKCREALQLFDEIPQTQHKTGWVLHQEGRAYFEMADYQNAKRCLELMQRVEPHRMKGLELLSTVLWQLKKEVELAHLAQRTVDFDRLSREAWCVVGNCFSLQKEHETALIFFGRSLQLDPSFTYTHTLSGYEYMANEDFDKAMACFRNGIRSDERHYNAWYGMGAIYHRQEKFDLAEYHFQRAVEINPQSSVLRCNLGMSQFSNGKTMAALQTLSGAFRLDPHNPQARFQRATIYVSLNRLDEALEELEKVRDAAPREAAVHFAMGKVLKRLGRPEQAMRCFLTALDLDPKDNQLIKSAMDKLEEPDVLDEEVAAF